MVSFTPLPCNPRGKSAGTHWIGGWLCPRVSYEKIVSTIGSIFHLLLTGFLCDLFFDPEDGGSAFV
jgi:hypothetical protein